MKKVFDKTFKKGVHSDDSVGEAEKTLVAISHKPTEQESKLVNGDIGDMSYYCIYEKKFRIIVYIED